MSEKAQFQNSDRGTSNGEGFIEIGPVVSELGPVCKGFGSFWTNLDHLG